MDEFLEKIEKHRGEFYRFVLRNVWDSGVSEDGCSRGVVGASENRNNDTPGTNLRAWMFRILMNTCFVANRETARAFEPLDSPAVAQALAAQPEPRIAALENPAAVLEQCGDEVFRAFRGLSTAQRTCILLRGIERFSYQEIAEIMEIPVGTVMTHLARGRKKLRQELADYAKETGIIREFPRLRQREESAKENEGKGS